MVFIFAENVIWGVGPTQFRYGRRSNELYDLHCPLQWSTEELPVPDRREITSSDELGKAVRLDHVCVELKDNYRSDSNFLSSNVVVMDCDNDHSDNPSDWITPDKLDELMPISRCLGSQQEQHAAEGKPQCQAAGHVYSDRCHDRQE